MKKIAITLTIAVAIFATTLIFTSLYISKLAELAAEYQNDQILDRFCSEMEDNILLIRQSAYNFLSFGFYESTDKINDNDGTFQIEQKTVHFFKAYVYDYLETFMDLNEDYASAVFVVDSSVCRQYFNMEHSFAPAIVQGDSVPYDWSETYDFMKSVHYAQLKETHEAFWSVPTKGSIVEGQVMSLYIPLILEDGCFFGAFIVSVETDFIKNHLRHNLPYGEEHSQMQLIDENGTVFAAYPPTLEKEGEKYCTYERTTTNVPWTIRTVCEKDAVYETAIKISWFIILTSLTGMVLVFICCYVIFRQTNKNMREKATIEHELRMAADMQLSILKPATSKSDNILIENFIRPAKEAGGDLYDYVHINGKTLVIIGDVSGKGMPAALFMTQVVSLFRNAVRYTQAPDEITAQINDSLSDNNPTMTFCTAIILSVSQDGHVTYCNAGHTLPVWVHNHTDNAEYLAPHSNIVMGVMSGYKYLCDEVTCAPGDSLLFYTDGVTEAMNKSSKLYGESRLLKAVNKSDDIQAILSDIEAFTQGAPQSDDITITRLFFGEIRS